MVAQMENMPILKKVPADSVPYGFEISRYGKYVWAAYSGDRLVCLGPTKNEAAQRYRLIRLKQASEEMRKRAAKLLSEWG